MLERTYRRTVNSLVAASVVAVLLHDRVGEYGWLASVVVAICAAAVVVVYFSLHWTQRAEESQEEKCTPRTDDAGTQPRSSGLPANTDPEPVRLVDFGITTAWVGSKFDPRTIGLLLAEMEKHKWRVSGTLRLHPPAPRDLTVHLVVRNQRVHLVPTFEGRLSPIHQKQALSKADFIEIERPSHRMVGE
jgi:Ca2+/Na+ antiporter